MYSQRSTSDSTPPISWPLHRPQIFLGTCSRTLSPLKSCLSWCFLLVDIRAPWITCWALPPAGSAQSRHFSLVRDPRQCTQCMMWWAWSQSLIQQGPLLKGHFGHWLTVVVGVEEQKPLPEIHLHT